MPSIKEYQLLQVRDEVFTIILNKSSYFILFYFCFLLQLINWNRKKQAMKNSVNIKKKMKTNSGEENKRKVN